MQPRSISNIGRYQIVGELGQGAMGVVYKARDPKIDRFVAIKTIALRDQNSTEQREFRERFFNEAKAAGRLTHPRIVTVFDVGEDPESHDPFIVMEYVSGQSLEQQLQHGRRLPLPNTLQLVQEVADALDYAHTQGIVHRDIKPANIMLTEEGHAKIADFGVAKLNLSNLTLSGNTFGTPAFMSPEQLNGETVDGRSDLFSLGVVLYTLLTGFRPFQGNSALTVSFKVVNREPVPVSALDADISPALDYIVNRAMSKAPEERYQTGMEMALDIQDIQQNFIPRSSMTPRSSQSAPAQKLFEEVSQGTGKYPVLPSVVEIQGSASRAAKKRQPRGSLVWQYALAIVLAAGVLGLWVSFFRHQRGSDEHAIGQPSSRAPGLQSSPVSKTDSVADPNSVAPEINAANQVSTPEESALQENKASIQSRPSTRSIPHRPPAPPKALASPSTSSSSSGFLQEVKSSQVAPHVANSTLHIRIEHRFPQVQAMIWVDDKLAYEQSLGGTVKKRMVVFKAVQGYESDSLQVSAGDHQIRVRVQSDDNTYDESDTIAATLPANGERSLRITCEKHKPIKLALQ